MMSKPHYVNSREVDSKHIPLGTTGRAHNLLSLKLDSNATTSFILLACQPAWLAARPRACLRQLLRSPPIRSQEHVSLKRSALALRGSSHAPLIAGHGGRSACSSSRQMAPFSPPGAGTVAAVVAHAREKQILACLSLSCIGSHWRRGVLRIEFRDTTDRYCMQAGQALGGRMYDCDNKQLLL